ncbi:MAG: serine O-acetyltransferase [Moraxellaceae bacterium]
MSKDSLWAEVRQDMSAYESRRLNVFRALKHLLFNLAVQTLLIYRISHRVIDIPFAGVHFAFVFSWIGQLISSCHINPRARIGGGLHMPHPTGVVIGEGCVIARRVTIFQGVTLGKKADIGGYPAIDEGAVLYAGACVIGDVTIGKGAVVGANSVVLSNVSPGRVVVGAPAREI